MELRTIYIICLALGFGLPLLNVLVGGITEALDIDFDFELDGFAVSDFLPLRPMCILTFLLFFGGVGLFTLSLIPSWLSIVAGSISGWLAAVLVNKFVIKPLRKNKCEAITVDELVGRKASLTVRLSPGGTGAVLLELPQGLIAYQVKSVMALTEPLEVGTEVIITGHTSNKGILLVEPVEKVTQAKQEEANQGLESMTL